MFFNLGRLILVKLTFSSQLLFFPSVFHKDGDVNKCLLQFTDADLEKMWQEFTTTGLTGQGKAGVSDVRYQNVCLLYI